ncbi:MAG: HPr family phosphocarrier protein [Isosphaeraceae bacterium]
MDDAPISARRRVQIVNTYGLHMRPSTRFVKTASPFESEVWVEYNSIRANGKSILEMTSLAAECGDWLEIEGIGPDAEEALDALEALVRAGFHMGDEGA